MIEYQNNFIGCLIIIWLTYYMWNQSKNLKLFKFNGKKNNNIDVTFSYESKNYLKNKTFRWS